jgi:hypothetical protein
MAKCKKCEGEDCKCDEPEYVIKNGKVYKYVGEADDIKKTNEDKEEQLTLLLG